MTDVQDVYCGTFDGEQNPVYMRRTAIEQVSHLEGKLRILGSQRAAERHVRKRRNGVFEPQKPAETGIPGKPGYQPFQD